MASPYAPIALPRLFDDADCERLLAVAEAAGFTPARLVGGVASAQTRRAGLAWLDDAAAEAAGCFALVARALADAAAHYGFAIEELAERMQVAAYEADDAGHFDWHVDCGAGALAARRKLTLVAQLTPPDAYEGGRLELNADGRPWSAPIERGAAAIFPSFVLHRVTPVTRGRRASLTLWAHGPAFR